MFKILDNSDVIGFDTETGTRYTASDTDFIEFCKSLPEELQIKDYSDTYDCYAAVVKAAAYISTHLDLLKQFQKKVSDYSNLERYIKEYALKSLHPADKLKDYDLISKITYPRFACVVGCDFKQIRNFSDSENIFYSENKTHFILKNDSVAFIDYLINRIKNGDNFAIVTFNMEYDFNALMCNVRPTYLIENEIIDERLPTKIHADKTITWKCKNSAGCCKWVDAMLLAEKGLSIKKYGEIASRLYNKDYQKQEYDYDNIIYSVNDLLPDSKELEYCYQDVKLALWGLAYLLRQHVKVLDQCNLLQKPSDLPITCSHLYDMVNVINTLEIDMSVNRSKRKKYFSSYKKNNAKNNEDHYNPPDKELYDFFKKGFGGGKISFNPLILEQKLTGGNGYSLDLCSAYPFQLINVYPDLQKIYIMDDNYFEKQLIKINKIAGIINQGDFVNIIPMFDHGFTARIRIKHVMLKSDQRLPLLGNLDGGCKLYGDHRIIRNRIIKADCLDITVTHADLITILAGYDIGQIELIKGYVYKLRPMNLNLRRKFIKAAEYKSLLKTYTKKDYKDFPYKDFNEAVGQDLLTGKETAEEVKSIVADAYQNSKVLFNGIYGKACQSLIHQKKFIDEEGNISITDEEYKPRQGTCYTTGRYIATYTRLHLCMAYFIALRKINKGDLILYSHTDSLKLYLFSKEHDKIITDILTAYNKGVDDETEYFYLYNLKRCRKKETENELNNAYKVLQNNGIGYLEDEYKNRFNKAVVCGNMRILTESENDCHITFSGLNVPYVLSGGKENYNPVQLQKYIKKEGIFNLYDKYFCSGRKYTIFESCKTTLDYKHYNMVLNPELGHICQTIKELPVEINGDSTSLAIDQDNINYWRVIYNEKNNTAVGSV